MNMMRYSAMATRGGACLAVATVLVVAAGSPKADAAILNTSGVTTVDVQEFLDGMPASFSAVETAFPEGAAELPINASTRVESTDLDELLVAIGQGFSELGDPMRLNQPNPEELSLEVACYSNAGNVRYTVTGSVMETRTVVFTSPGSAVAPPEIEFRSDGTREIESSVFLSGAMMIWTPDLDEDNDGLPDGSLDDLLAEVSFTVMRPDTEDESAEGESLFRTSFTIRGAGDAVESPDVVGPIVHELITLDELIAGGLDAATAAMLTEIEAEGSLTIIAFPMQEHRYRYVVRADEAFELVATMDAMIRNVPGGSGVAVALGRPFTQLIEFVESALAGSNGESVEKALNDAVAARDIGLVPTGGSNGLGRRILCGAFGAELMAMTALAGFVGFVRRHRLFLP
jgi:hypothetical protein